jgi:integrative and conjugative element protein (TIGR02256 family)
VSKLLGASIGGIVWVAQALLEQIERESAAFAPNETGGVLMGYGSDTTYQITASIGAGPKAVRTRSSFSPDGTWQLDQIASCYEAASRRIRYLGDWHSHPDGSSRPSWRDWRTTVATARTAEAYQRHPLLAIVGRRSADWEIGLWHLGRVRLHPCAVALLPDEQRELAAIEIGVHEAPKEEGDT